MRPVWAYANEMLWAMSRVAPAARAASHRLRVPWLRRRLFSSNCSAKRFGSIAFGMLVSWWITASGRASASALVSAAASKASTTTGSAPRSRIRAARSSERVLPVTSWPAARSMGSSLLPIAPAAPATKTLTPADASAHQD